MPIPPNPPLVGPAECLAKTLEWLFVVFEDRIGLAEILAIVHDSYLLLDIDEDPSAIHLLERVAFGQLDARVTSRWSACRSMPTARGVLNLTESVAR